MTALSAPIAFASAYRQLTYAEKAYVDAYVTDAENRAVRANERISLALHRPIPDDIIDASRGMLDKPMVRAAISERINELAAANELTPHRVIKEWMGIAFSSVGDYMQIGEDGQPYFDLTRCTPEQLAAIKSVEVEESGGAQLGRPTKRKFKFVLHDKIAGLVALQKYMGLDDGDNSHWRSENARPIGPAALPANMTTEGAGNLYAQMING